MIILNAGGFFQDFNFDTLLALISCIAGIVALFLGGAAYKNCKIIKDSFNEQKEFEDNSQDHSQHAAGNIINNGISSSQLVTITSTLATMNNANFSDALDRAQKLFQKQHEANLENIIAKTNQLIADNRLQIAGYSKTDWINIYFESAKNASDAYMQNVWAKVLAKEMAIPGTFSYKTLDILKNMSRREVELFEVLASINFSKTIVKGDYLDELGLNWETLQRLKDFGLINLEGSQLTIPIGAHKEHPCLIQQSHVFFVKGKEDEATELKLSCYLLTVPAQELISLVTRECTDDEAIKVVKAVIDAHSKKNFSVSLHKVNYLMPNGVNYYDNVIFKKE